MPSSFALGDHFENFIKSMVASGRYNNASEVVREALRDLEDRERDRERDSAELDAFLAKSFEESDAGLGQSVDDARLRVAERIAANRASRAG